VVIEFIPEYAVIEVKEPGTVASDAPRNIPISNVPDVGTVYCTLFLVYLRPRRLFISYGVEIPYALKISLKVRFVSGNPIYI
jgi:hypothetical protein